jgi:hypothetical protein
MGYTRWSDADYQTYSETTNYRAATSVSAVFSNTAAPPSDFVVQNIQVRESRDSELNPRSTPIILGLDVTGSMGKYAAQIAQEHLPNLMSHIINNSVVSDPHILVMGIGDPRAGDNYPAQATQFEPDLKIIEQTRDLFIEGRGGGNDVEGYDLAWYFAKYCTSTDAVQKGRKGVIFTFGDEQLARNPLTEHQWKKVFGTKEYPQFSSMGELYAMVSQDWEIFHVIIEQGNYCRSAGSSVVRRSWTQVLPSSRVLNCSDSSQLKNICSMALEILNTPVGQPLPYALYENSELKHAFSGLLEQNA